MWPPPHMRLILVGVFQAIAGFHWAFFPEAKNLCKGDEMVYFHIMSSDDVEAALRMKKWPRSLSDTASRAKFSAGMRDFPPIEVIYDKSPNGEQPVVIGQVQQEFTEEMRKMLAHNEKAPEHEQLILYARVRLYNAELKELPEAAAQGYYLNFFVFAYPTWTEEMSISVGIPTEIKAPILEKKIYSLGFIPFLQPVPSLNQWAKGEELVTLLNTMRDPLTTRDTTQRKVWKTRPRIGKCPEEPIAKAS